MANGIQFEVESDTIQIFPSGIGQTASFSIDDIVINVAGRSSSFEFQVNCGVTDQNDAIDQIKGLRTIEIDDEELAKHESSENKAVLLRTCINCNGRQYCMSGGCANTPCGWICG